VTPSLSRSLSRARRASLFDTRSISLSRSHPLFHPLSHPLSLTLSLLLSPSRCRRNSHHSPPLTDFPRPELVLMFAYTCR
jgi:hypothetical protein